MITTQTFSPEDLKLANQSLEGSSPQQVLQWAVDNFHPRLTMATAVRASPSALTALMQLRETLAHGSLRVKTRETLALALAQYNECDYCLSAHVASSPKAGMDEAAIAAARSGNSSDARVDAAAKFALAVARNRGNVSDDDVAHVRAAGYSDGEIVEIIANVALNLFTNYINKVAQTEIDFPPVHANQTVEA